MKVALNFEDGQTQVIRCLPGETVANAAYRCGINIPLDCRDGACGTCKARCESGSFDMTDFIEEALSPAEVESGQVLTCKMIPTSDCIVDIPATLKDCSKALSERFITQIKSVVNLSNSAFVLTLSGDGISKLDFLPGQYGNIEVPGLDIKRAYSFSSLVHKDQISFLIKTVPNGKMSGHLTKVSKAGDNLYLQGPIGSFYLRQIKRPVLMLAGGTGLAPFISMLEQIEVKANHQHAIQLVYGVTNDEDLVCLDILDQFAKSIPGFSFTACVADKTSNYINTGFVTDHIPAVQLQDGNVDIYLCGPPPMVNAVEMFLSERKIVPASFHYEKFVASH